MNSALIDTLRTVVAERTGLPPEQVWVALAAGLVAALLLVVLVYRTVRRRSGATPQTVSTPLEPPAAGPSSGVIESAHADPVTSPLLRSGMTDTPSSDDAGGATSAADVSNRRGSERRREPSAFEEPAEVSADEKPVSAKAEVPAAPPAAAAPLSASAALLLQAQDDLRTGDAASAASALREVIRMSVADGRPLEHAQARLELAELARNQGDLITACEHWQIARGIFHESRKTSDLKSIEKRMRDHGCPTDWVLNDF